MAPSNTLVGGFFGGAGPTEGDWINYGGCESGHGTVDKVTNKYAWSGCYDAGLQVINLENMHVRDVEVWPESAIGWAPKDIKERFHWSFPIEISPHDNNKVYIGSQRVHMTMNMGHSYTVISPDLTRNVESHQEDSGGTTTDNLQTYDGAVLYCIDESPAEAGVIWTGSNDGTVQVTRDGGQNWTNVSAKMPDLPEWAWIKEIYASPHSGGTVYIAVDDHLQGNTETYIYKSADYGQSWKRVDAGIPRSVHGYVHSIHEDPVKPGLLYAGTENQVWVSLNDGGAWESLRTNMPATPVYGLQVQTHFNDLVIATYGRGVWILDDITPLQQLTSSVRSSNVHLFKPKDTYRFQPVQPRAAAAESELRGKNPEYGASINYWMSAAPEDDVTIEILNAQGDLVRTLDGSKKIGINRIWWDLRHEDRKDPVLRTDPPGKDWVAVPDEGGRAPITWGSSFTQGPKAVPGTYTVRLTIGGEQRTQTVEVLKDPNSEGNLTDISAQVALSLQMQEEFNGLVAAVNKLEWIRNQVEDVKRSLEGTPNADLITEAADSLLNQAIEVEYRFIDVHLTGGVEDSFRHGMKLYGRYIELMRELDSTSDFPPTEQQQQVADTLRIRLEESLAALEQFLQTNLTEFNDFLREQNIPTTVK
jgi:hypothetical protein